jgi:hypothetical protein
VIKEDDDVFLIRNVKYGEYMYAAADDLAFDKDNRDPFYENPFRPKTFLINFIL